MNIDELLLIGDKEKIKQQFQKLEKKVKQLNKEIKLLHPKNNSFNLVKKAIDTAINGIFIYDYNHGTIYTNQSFLNLFGYSNHEEITNLDPSAIWEDEIEAEKIVQALTASSSWFGDSKAKRIDGTTFDAQMSANLIEDEVGNPSYLMASFIDISDLKISEKKLIASEKKYRTLVERLSEGVVIIGKERTIEFISPRMEQMLEYPPDELLGKGWRSTIVPKEELEKVNLEYSQRISGESSVYESSLLTRNNNKIHVLVSATPIKDDNDNIIGTMGAFTDITKIKKTEIELQKRRKLLRQVIDLIPVQIFAKDTEGKFIFVNKVVADLYNTSVENLIGKHHHLFHSTSSELETFLKSDNLVLKENKTLFIPEEPFTDSNGKEHIIQTIKKPFMAIETEKQAILGVSIDITEMKKAEKQIALVKQAEERFYLMMSHFTRNNFQKIVYLLEYIQSLYQKDETISQDTISAILNLAYQSSHAIDLVNEIFDVLKSEFKPISHINLLSTVIQISKLKDFTKIKFDIVDKSLGYEIYLDDYFEIILREIFTYLKIAENSVKIEGISTAGSFIISINDKKSLPIPNEARERLEKRVGDDWEYQGHYLGISLAAVILQYYSGFLQIIPQDTGGNCFLLSIPSSLIVKKE